MKICALSDTHGYDFTIPKCDVFCHCGDWSPLRIQDDFIAMQTWLEDFIMKLCSLPCKHVIIIAGNHDLCMESVTYRNFFSDTQMKLGMYSTEINQETGISETKTKVIYLNRDSVILNGIKFWGSPVTKQICRSHKYWAFETNTPTYDIPSDADVVLTHQPPTCNGLGNTYWKQSEPSKRLGCKALTEALTASNAKLFLCGHIHTGNHAISTLKNDVGTKACNVSMLDENYDITYPPMLIDLDR